MVLLLVGLAAGLLAGVLRASNQGKPYRSPNLRYLWLIILASLPQLIAFVLPTRTSFPDSAVPWVLVLSQTLLLAWVVLNVRKRGIWLLGLGLALNFLAIVLNGGMMPIRPELIQRLWPYAPSWSWEVGERFGWGKDVVLEVANTRLWFLSDYFALPSWLNYPLAFSIGDVLVAAGAFWIAYRGDPPMEEDREQAHS